MKSVALSILAHPDDAEFLCAGTLIRLGQLGWEVHVASMTPGDKGSMVHPPEEIARIRRAEGAAAARLIGATYHCLEERDLLIFYGERPLESITRLLRTVRPRLVFTHSPTDYMVDHEVTSQLARAAVFGAGIPNFFGADAGRPAGRSARRRAGQPPPLEGIPHLYYCDPIEGKDPLGRPVEPAFRIDVSSVIDTKAAMLAAHASQRDWLLQHHGMDQYLKAMRDWSSHQGQAAGVAYAEGFRQHLGHSYPQDNLLGQVLGLVG